MLNFTVNTMFDLDSYSRIFLAFLKQTRKIYAMVVCVFVCICTCLCLQHNLSIPDTLHNSKHSNIHR